MNQGWGPTSGRKFNTPMMDQIYPGHSQRTEAAEKADREYEQAIRDRNMDAMKLEREEVLQNYKDRIDAQRAENEEACARANRELNNARESLVHENYLKNDRIRMQMAMQHPGDPLPTTSNRRGGLFGGSSRSRSGYGSSSRKGFLGRRRRLLLFGNKNRNRNTGSNGYGSNNRQGNMGQGGMDQGQFDPFSTTTMSPEQIEQMVNGINVRYNCKPGWNPENGPYQAGIQGGGPHMEGPTREMATRSQGGMQDPNMNGRGNGGTMGGGTGYGNSRNSQRSSSRGGFFGRRRRELLEAERPSE